MINNALRTIMPIGGWSEDAADVKVAGPSDPVLPTPFKITETAVAAHSAVGLAVNDLWEMRTGRRQSIELEARRATASLRSTNYLRINGDPAAVEKNQVSGIYPAKNGRWTYLHANFPNHREAALKVLGVPERNEDVRNAVAHWDASELEESIIAAGGAGGMIRSVAEWRVHLHGQAVVGLPLMEIVKIGESPAETLPPGDRPLSGIRVLDLTRVIAGPTCARTLAEHGADVLKITASHLPSLGLHEYDVNHGKHSAHVDLREERGRDILRGLIRDADVFSQGYRPGTLGSRGFSPEALAELRPGIVCVSLSAFGHAGPWASRRGFDTVIQAVSGISTRQGEVFPGAKPGPQFFPIAAIDYLTGYLMAAGAMLALARRAQEGGSWLVRISLAQVGKWLVDQGEVPESDLDDIAKEFTPDELERWSMASETPIGRLQHLGPVLRFSETPARWARPAVPLGYHDPVWPERD